MLLANKCDAPNRQVDQMEIEDFYKVCAYYILSIGTIFKIFFSRATIVLFICLFLPLIFLDPSLPIENYVSIQNHKENNFIGWTETSAKEGLMVNDSMR